ncbi:MAG: sigma-70 family RNA polymerase sigma factor [Vicinamibacterales bacterium]
MSTRDLTAPGALALTSDDDSAVAEASRALHMDEAAFRGFYDRTARMLWVYLYRMLGDRSAADDLLQDTYSRFLRARVAFESETHRRRYLFQIATNLSRDRHRYHAVRPSHVSHDEVPEAAELSVDGAASLTSRLQLEQALGSLKPRERQMLWLAYGYGASHLEIADVVGIRANSVKTLLHRARRKLAGLLGRPEGRS